MHLFYFIENQMESYEVLRDLLLSCRQNLKDVLCMYASYFFLITLHDHLCSIIIMMF